ncbi:aryl-sulfate sulfotransferase [Kordia sp. YSTF-M3]|uniref:Aryl-sulfate sulfotransferase n=1 Tax=Kordia aestuariivivens TaxID=2759037 RepID=A0ABR7Q4E7_9FLAO|nr:aryl-sulfate sulfotransferase [Kordia aestuariivivens]MBC8753422.1 aryl-sulfate sulfotransferase [Kordia aestuariivivens]
MKIQSTLKHFLVASLVAFASCSDDDPATTTDPDPVVPTLAVEVEIYDPAKIHDNLTLAVVNGSQTAFLMDKAGQKLHEWTFDDNLGNDLELLPNGKLLGLFKGSTPSITFGGFGGVARIINLDGSIDWEYTLNTDDFILHHDVEMLPNGNILLLVWERIDEATAELQGSANPGDIYPEKLMEINPETNAIVWEWRSFDHIIQDNDAMFPNYGSVSQNPHKIHINYNPANNGDIMHANGFDYDTAKDVIYLSVNFFSEVWVIDHSTTTAEAASSTGGNYGKGGDLLYRFGNPLAYGNTVGEVRSDNNHFPNLLENGVPGEGNMLIFVNGFNAGASKVMELEMPETFSLTPDADNEPNVVWSFEHPDFFASKLSGAVRLSNGNTLICEGDFGFWEVTPEKDIAWRYNGGDGAGFWRCYDYEVDDPVLNSLGL